GWLRARTISSHGNYLGGCMHADETYSPFSFRLAASALIVALAIVVAPRTPSAAPATITIRLATVAPKDTSYHRILLEMGEQWKKTTDQRVSLTVFPGGNQGSEADTVRRMRINQLQAGMLSAGGLTEIDPAVAALQEIPMLFHSLAEEEYVRERLRPDLEKRLLAKGFVAL